MGELPPLFSGMNLDYSMPAGVVSQVSSQEINLLHDLSNFLLNHLLNNFIEIGCRYYFCDARLPALIPTSDCSKEARGFCGSLTDDGRRAKRHEQK